MISERSLARTAVVIPIRAFNGGQARLADLLDAPARADLGRNLATRVRDAARPQPVIIVSDAPEVRTWAQELGVTAVLDDPGDLNRAASVGVAHAGALGFARVVVAHADLPWVTSFATVSRDGTRPVAVAVPCPRDDGTPVLSVPTSVAFDFAYGPGSFRHHAQEARRRGLGFRVVRDAKLAFDVDLPEDLVRLEAGIVGR